MGGIWGEGRGKNHNGKSSNMEGGGGYGARGVFSEALGYSSIPPHHHISCSNLIPWLVYHKLEWWLLSSLFPFCSIGLLEAVL